MHPQVGNRGQKTKEKDRLDEIELVDPDNQPVRMSGTAAGYLIGPVLQAAMPGAIYSTPTATKTPCTNRACFSLANAFCFVGQCLRVHTLHRLGIDCLFTQRRRV